MPAVEDELQGVRTSPRFLAACVDNLFAIVLVVIAASLPARSPDPVRLAAGTLAYLGYFFLFEGALGRTLGKLLFGLVVRRLDGTRAGWREAGMRTLLRLVEVNPALLGALPAGLAVAFSPKHQRFGDMWAGTVVVSVR